MGVDYTAVSGYGFVLGPDEKALFLNSEDGDYYEDIEKFLEKYSELQILVAGSYAYSGDEDDLALAVVVGASWKSGDVHCDRIWSEVHSEDISEEAEAQLKQAANDLAIDNPRFAFVSGVHVW